MGSRRTSRRQRAKTGVLGEGGRGGTQGREKCRLCCGTVRETRRRAAPGAPPSGGGTGREEGLGSSRPGAGGVWARGRPRQGPKDLSWEKPGGTGRVGLERGVQGQRGEEGRVYRKQVLDGLRGGLGREARCSGWPPGLSAELRAPPAFQREPVHI